MTVKEWTPEDDAVWDQFEFWKANQDELNEIYDGKTIIIWNQQVIAAFKDSKELHRYWDKFHPGEHLCMASCRIRRRDRETIFVPFSRVKACNPFDEPIQ